LTRDSEKELSLPPKGAFVVPVISRGVLKPVTTKNRGFMKMSRGFPIPLLGDHAHLRGPEFAFVARLNVSNEDRVS
jgi:hypothetical protein